MGKLIDNPSGGGLTNINVSAGTTSNNLSALTFSNLNGVSFGLDGSTITAQHNGLTSQSNQAFSAEGGSSAFQTLVFRNVNGISFSNSDGSVQASYTVPTLTAFVFSDSNGVSFGTNGSTVTATVKTDYLTSQSNQALSGSNGSFTFQTATFGNLNNFSFYTSNGSIVGSYTVPTVTNSAWTVSDPATSGTVARLAFTNLNGVTLSLSSGANGSHTIVGSHNALTSQSTQFMAITLGGNSAGTSTFHATDNASIFLHGGNNITLSGNGSTITIIGGGGGGAVVSNAIQAVGSATGSGTNTSRFAADDHVHEGVYSNGVSNVGNTAGNTAVRPGRWVFAGSNGVTLSQETAANSLQTIHIQGPSIATTASQVGSFNVVGTNNRYALEDHRHAGVAAVAAGSNTGNTAGNTATNFGTWVIAGTNNITVSGSTAAGGIHTIWLSGPAAGGGDAIRGIAANGSTASTNTVHFSNSNNISFGFGAAGNSTVLTADVGLAASDSAGSFTFKTLNFSNANNVTFGTSAGGIITASVAAPGGGADKTASFWEVNNGIQSTCALWNNATYSNRAMFFPFQIEKAITAISSIRIFASRTGGTSAAATLFAGIYTIANSTSMNLVSSTSFNISVTTSAQFSGIRGLNFTGLGAMSLSPGQYVLALQASMPATASWGMNLIGNNSLALGGWLLPGTNSTAATASGSRLLPFQGVFNATSAGLPSAVGTASISGGNGANSPKPYFAFLAIP